jgi:hypothetical protein
MKTATPLLTEAGQQYAAAYAAHYTTKDLHDALRLYRGIMAAHPNTPEAGYSQSQILNIVKSVVPNQEPLDAQAELALAHLEQEKPPDLEPLPVTPHTSELPSQRKAARSPGESI